MSVRLAPATWVRLKNAAEKVDVAPSELVRHIIETAIGEAV
jgi:predicted DNA-binding protein